MARQKHLHVPVIGDTILADGWRGIVEMLREGDKPVDSGYPGCQFRVTCFQTDVTLAVNVTTTGQPKWVNGIYKSRCKIEFVGDCEPSTFAGGYIFHKEV
jgi:hypothetical protein